MNEEARYRTYICDCVVVVYVVISFSDQQQLTIRFVLYQPL